jgi:hypothetical protein
MKIYNVVFWLLISLTLAGGYRHFGDAHYLHLHDNIEDGGRNFNQNFGNHFTVHFTSSLGVIK